MLIYTPDHPGATLCGSKYILEYRLIAEKKLGRRLLRSEIVHHINGDINDNRPENLEIMTQAEHARRHFTGRKRHDLKHDPITGRILPKEKSA